jgi:hypothetical protein
MKLRSIGTLVGLAALTLMMLPSVSTAQGCGNRKDSFRGYNPDYEAGADADLYVLAQSFETTSSYELCAVSVILQSLGAGSEQATLYVQSDETDDPAFIYASAVRAVFPGPSAEYKFNLTNFEANQGQEYFIRVVGYVAFRDSAAMNGHGVVNWLGGDAYQDGGMPEPPSDHYFKAWAIGTPIPTVPEWGLIVLGMGLLISMAWTVWRRQAASSANSSG